MYFTLSNYKILLRLIIIKYEFRKTFKYALKRILFLQIY